MYTWNSVDKAELLLFVGINLRIYICVYFEV